MSSQLLQFRQAIERQPDALLALLPRLIESIVETFIATYPPHRLRPEQRIEVRTHLYALFSRPDVDEAGLGNFEAFAEGFDRWISSKEWKRDGGQWVPGAIKFINEQIWRRTKDAANQPLQPGPAERLRKATMARSTRKRVERIAASTALPANEYRPPIDAYIDDVRAGKRDRSAYWESLQTPAVQRMIGQRLGPKPTQPTVERPRAPGRARPCKFPGAAPEPIKGLVCKCCGDPAITVLPHPDDRALCVDCYQEIVQGVLPESWSITGRVPHVPFGMTISSRGSVPGTRQDEENDYFGKHFEWSDE